MHHVGEFDVGNPSVFLECGKNVQVDRIQPQFVITILYPMH
jgi:hypothetical protein